MCQLLAITSRFPISPFPSLSGFFQRAGNTAAHTDGWGVAMYRNNELEIRSHASAAASCSHASNLLAESPQSTTFVCHIRKATHGSVCLENTHPFARDLWNGTWVFSHNGDLSDFHPELNDSFRPVGTTDSEVAFCWILQQLSFQFGDQMPPLDELVSFLALLSRYVSLHGTFNYVLANGPLLIVHCSTELYWTERRFPYGVVELLDTGLKVDLNRLNQSDGAMTVLATHPLTRGEVWCPMGRGELRVYKDGELLHSKSAPSDAFPDEQVWSQRWKEGAIRLV